MVASMNVYAQVVFESVATNTGASGTTTLTINNPTGTALDDLLLAVIATKESNTNITAPVGWVELYEVANGNHTDLATFWKVADASDVSATDFDFGLASDKEVAGAVLRYSGVDTSSPIDISSAVSGGGKTNSPISPDVTTTVDDALVVRIFSQKDNKKDVTPPSGTVERVDLNNNDKITIGVADATQAVAGATGTAAFTGNDNKEWVGATVALAPLPKPVLTIDKDTTTVGDVSVSETAAYTIVVTNTDTVNNLSGLGVSVSDTLATGFTYASGSVGFSGCADVTVDSEPTSGDSVLSWGTWDMEENCVITLTFTVNVDGDAVLGINNNATSASGSNFDTVTDDGTDIDEDVNVTCTVNSFYNSASVTLNETDPDLTNNTDDVCTAILVHPDYGDGPISYGIASHVHSTNLYIGDDSADGEPASNFSADADGDSTDRANDEGGVTFTSSPGADHAEVTAIVPVTNDTGGDAFICAWMDIWAANGSVDGVFDDPADAQESGVICQTVPDNGGVAVDYNFVWDDLENTSGTTFLRFRVCTTEAECNTPTGAATNGEVEDYQLVYDFTPTAVTIGSITLNSVAVVDFLQQITTEQNRDEQLRALLASWDSSAAEDLSSADVLTALLNFLDPDGDGRVALLEWDTLEERGTIGFYAERFTGTSSWTRINDDMLPGLITAPMGGEYLLADPAAQSGKTYRYKLIEQEATGSTRVYGPFILEME